MITKSYVHMRHPRCVITLLSSASAAEPVYENVDGMEMALSVAEIDARALPVDQYDDTIEGREL